MSETVTMTLTEFLLARIAEDEATARAAGSEQWYWSTVPGPSMRRARDEPSKTVLDSPGSLISYEMCQDEFADHAANFDPARVLAECEAKRRIVEEHVLTTKQGVVSGKMSDGEAFIHGYESIRCATCGFVSEGRQACATLHLLTLPYADHPDYREEWRP